MAACEVIDPLRFLSVDHGGPVRLLACGHRVCESCLRAYLPKKIPRSYLGCAVERCVFASTAALLTPELVMLCPEVALEHERIAEDIMWADRRRMQLIQWDPVDNPAREVYPNIYVGGEGDAMNRERLVMDFGVSHVLNVAVCTKNYCMPDLIYRNFDAHDTPEFDMEVDTIADYIHSVLADGGVLLVHCVKGVSRSVTCVMAYLIKYRRFTVAGALARIKEKRPIAAPNIGFLLQLADLAARTVY
jgi:hypothetical protein